jgi:DNA-binding CsgD family transcriptional regulator
MRVKERTAELRAAFKELEVKSKSFEETNTALKVLLEKRDGDKVELEEKLTANVNQLIEPYLEKLKNTNLDERQKAFLSIVEANLKDIASPFLKSLTGPHLRLTPTEIQVAELVKQGKSAKEIADVMNLSWKTVKTHRRNIRSKLNLKNKKTNLRSYLLSNQK